MATLKSLVDETTNIKTNITNSRDTLRQILINKKITGLSNSSTLTTLISKVNDLEDHKPKYYLYKDGDMYDSLTGGYSVTWRDSKGNGSVTNTSTYLQLYYIDDSAGGTAMSCGTAKTINCTPYTKLCMQYSSNGFGSFSFGIATTTNSTGVNTSYIGCADVTDMATGVVDISNISGNFYIKWYGWGAKRSGGSTMKVYKIWME